MVNNQDVEEENAEAY